MLQGALIALLALLESAEAGLSVPKPTDVNRDGSLAQQIALSEVQVLIANSTNYGALFSSAISEQLSAGKLTSLDAISGIYDAVPKGLFRPMSTDISDATFGQERITTKAMKLHQVRPNEYRSSRAFALTDAQLSKLCGRGATWNNIRRQKQLYVEDYHDIAQWNDPEAPENTVNVFVQRYIDVYYKNDQAIKSDFELQNWARDWARDCALVPHLKEFPSTFTAKAQLQRLLTRLIYLSAPALCTGSAARKGVPVNLMDFVAPPVTLPVILGDLSAFVRPVAPVHSWLGAYAVAPFSQEAALQPAIADLQMSLRTIDTFIQKQERGQKWPYEYLRPSTLPYFSWI
ncbi:hypothetical protein Poli38472_014950 [Pythium oligandrum]|uniref:Uncharacterized protein n=1 Tax=Pythium oligandrum TaxID=41045 RepID=A0A8K1C7X1_PYTOL|nr:hypothetical protein Poli38472_014950 [Pythium oligandrum]|eukprot:TMW57642.1 hypothetical protein Poli38472_014950 [Pythium oligandrum]